MKDEEEENNQRPLLNDILEGNDNKLDNQIEKKDEEMRDSFEKFSKILNKMEKNVENMSDFKLMNYQNLFNEFDNDMIRFNDEQKKLLELKDILNSETNLPDKVKKNLSKVNKDFENKKKIFEKLKTKVEEYKEKYTKEENKKYDDMFNEAKEKKNQNEEEVNQKLIIKNSDEILQERKKIIENAKKTSSQVVDTSRVIKNVIHQQGECLNDIENNIIESVDNFKKGGEEIKKFKKKNEQKINKKCVCIGIAAVFVLVLVIYFMMKKLF
jgi:syntaxin 7